MRVAYLVFNHRPIEQLMRFLNTLRGQQQDSPIIVHHNRFACDIDTRQIEKIDGVRVRTSDYPIAWGDFSIVDSYWNTLAWMRDNYSFDWTVLLSGQDYPVRPLSELESMLSATNADAFVEADRVDNWPNPRERRDREQRYLYQYRGLPDLGIQRRLSREARSRLRQLAFLGATAVNRTQPVVQIYRFPALIPYRWGIRSSSTPFTTERPCWCGSVWNALNQKAVQTLLDYVDEHADYARFYRRTIIPDESATQTILCNHPELAVAPHNLHYTRWSNPRAGHPDVFGASDLSALIASERFFARKFDLNLDGQIFDLLDDVLAAS